MALNPVTLAETLRPWHGAGLAYLLREVSVAGQAAARPADPALPARLHMPPPAEKDEPPRPLSSRARFEGEDAPPAETPSTIAATTATPISAALPKEWAEILAKTPKAPLLWTYAALGQDLGGRGDKARSACLRELIGRLLLPRGTSGFWPVTLCEDWLSYAHDDSPAPDAMHFQAGLRQLSPKVVIFIGEPALILSGLQGGPRIPFTQTIQQGRLYLLLPDFEALLGTTTVAERSVAYLQSAFAAYPSLFNRTDHSR